VGFSLLELIISVSLLFIIGVASVFILQNQLHGTLETDAEVMASRLIEAQTRAIAGVSNTGWGVRFHNATATTPYYALFSGSSFATSTLTYYLSGLVEFQSPGAGNITDVAFSKLSGTLSASTTIIIRLKTDSAKTKTITVTDKGKISVE